MNNAYSNQSISKGTPDVLTLEILGMSHYPTWKINSFNLDFKPMCPSSRVFDCQKRQTYLIHKLI